MKQIITKLVDDLDGSEAAETVWFGMDGAQFTIDLSDVNAKQLRDVLAPYIAAGSKVTNWGRPASQKAVNGSKAELAKIRQWAEQVGIHVAARGRIPTDVRRQYEQSAA